MSLSVTVANNILQGIFRQVSYAVVLTNMSDFYLIYAMVRCVVLIYLVELFL